MAGVNMEENTHKSGKRKSLHAEHEFDNPMLGASDEEYEGDKSRTGVKMSDM